MTPRWIGKTLWSECQDGDTFYPDNYGVNGMQVQCFVTMTVTMKAFHLIYDILTGMNH